MSDAIFPLDSGKVTWATQVSQAWDIQEAKSASGRRRTLCQQSLPSWKFSLNFPALTKNEVDALMMFFSKMRGKWNSFWYKDFENHHVDNAVLTLTPEGYYQCMIPIGEGEIAEKIDNVHVFVDGEEINTFTVEGGHIMMDYQIVGEVSASYDYYFRVAFDDTLQISQKFKNVYGVGINLTVVRE